MDRVRRRTLLGACAFAVSGCEYTKLLRPSVPSSSTPAWPGSSISCEVDHGFMRPVVCAMRQFLGRKPAIVVMPHGGDLELDVTNEDHNHHMAFTPSGGERQVLDLPRIPAV
jgi:hypothetical protein